MSQRRRILLIALASFALLAGAAWMTLHSRPVQREVADRVIAAVREQTGWTIGIGELRVRLWPARLVATGVVVSTDTNRVATVDRLEASWRWSDVMAAPYRLGSVELTGVVLDLRDLELPETPEPSPEAAPVDPWRAVELNRLKLKGGHVDGRVLDVEATLDGVRVRASLVDARASAAVEADRLVLTRQDRALDMGSVSLRGAASEAGVIVEELAIEGGDIAVETTGTIDLDVGTSGRFEFVTRADLAAVAGWWDPNLVTGLDAAGVLDLEGWASFDPESGFTASAEHKGRPIRVVGYELDELELGFADGVPIVDVAGSAWGRATVSVADDGVASVAAQLRNAPVGDLLAFVAPGVASAVPGPVGLSGVVDGTVAFPFSLETLGGSVDLEAVTSRGRLAVVAEGRAETWTVRRFTADAATVNLDGSGSLDPGGRVSATVDLRVDDVATALELVEPWFDLPPEFVPGGGPVVGSAVLSGTIGDPRFETRLEWPNPLIVGRELDLLRAEAEGDRETIAWSIEATATPESRAVVDGVLDVGAGRTEGSWRVELDQLEPALALFAGDTVELPAVSGSLRGDGFFAWSPEEWRIEGRAGGAGLAADVWVVDQIDLEFEGGPAAVAINDVSARVFGGRLTGRGELGLEGIDAPLSLALDWSDIDLGELPVDLPDGTDGRMNGRLSAGGTLGRPTAEVELDWKPDDPSSPVPPITAAGSLEDGVLRLVTREVSTDVGTAIAKATVPLGGLPRPAWLWPDAADEPVRVTVDGHDLRSEPILALLGVEPVPVSASAELTLDAVWHPSSQEKTRILAELTGFRLRHPGGEIEAEGPLEFHMDGGRVRLEPVILTGPRTRIEIGGEGDLDTGRLDGRLEAEIAPSIARLIPYPVQIYEPIRLSATASGGMDDPRVAIMVTHPGGAFVLRDPALFIRDLVVSAELADGRVWINDGRAEVNQGRVELGGGWDPESGQGIVAEVDNVVVFVEGILSQWSGTLAIEPEPGRIARITGELNLIAGLWDQDVSLGGALFGPASLDPAGDDPLFDIALDLDVRGRGIVRVDNNIGRFDARWDVLRVTGSAAVPEMRGKINIAPGGRFSLAGQRVTVRRGSLVFTGDPVVDPIVEIVPESDIAAFGGGDQIDTASLATQGLVGGLAGALGFENETLQPAEISVEVEKDSAQQLMLGQRISHNIALFFATNTSDVQDRTSMLQLWNLPGLKGLSLQGYQKTLTDEAGGNLIQRFQWGGSSLYDDRPVIRKLKLEGDWPIGKRRLKKATGFRRGQPYDPFLTFVAKVRMERELAGAGFQEASVAPRAAESNNAWTMVFECDPGPRQQVVFEGDEPPRRIRQEVTALYQPPPLESYGFRNMKSLLDRHYDAEGYPEAAIAVERRDQEVVATIARGDDVDLTGPVLAGAPEDVAQGLRHRLGSSTELALLATEEARAKRVVERTLTDLGYPGAVVHSVTKAGVGEGLEEVRIEADLGDRAVVRSFVLVGEDPLGLTRDEGFQLREGRPITRGTVDLAASQLRAGYDGAGYSDAEVSGSLVEDPGGGWRVTLQIEPGRRRKLESVEIVGLKHTSPKVIRSGITVEEGEILRNSDLDTTAVRIANFAPVERVDVRTVPQGVDGAKVVMEVAEKPRWTTEVGGGWSTERGAQARFGIRDDNLIGRGLNLNFRGRWDQTEWLGFVVASLPPPPGKRFSFTTTGGYSRGEAPENRDLDREEAFWSFEVTRWMGRGDLAVGTAGEQVTGYYRFSRTHTFGIFDDGFLPIEIDDYRDTGLLGVRYVHDRFDSPFDPTKGYGVVLDAATSRGILGSDVDFWTALGNGSMAMGAPLSSTWIQSLRVGVSEPLQGQDLIPEAKYFAGGQGSIRGFDRDSVGPVIYAGQNTWDPAGGGALLILNEELRIPVKGGFRAALFADIGQVWPSWGEADWNFAVGAGVGIRWATPIGPVWADVAWPVVNPYIDLPDWANPATDSRRMSSSKPKFYIGIGRPF